MGDDTSSTREESPVVCPTASGIKEATEQSPNQVEATASAGPGRASNHTSKGRRDCKRSWSVAKRQKARVFTDSDAMKEQIRKDLLKQSYNVFDNYYETGVIPYIAKHNMFENMTFIVVLANSVWIAVEADASDKQLKSLLYVVMAHFFCAYFTLEMLVRFFAFKKKRDAFRDRWFNFDFILVSFMVFETWLMPIAGVGGAGFKSAAMLRVIRIVRLFKIARVARLLRLLPELMLIIKGIVAATRSVFFVIVLIGIMIYVGAVGFKVHSSDTNWGQRHFPTVTQGMMTLLLNGSLSRGVEVLKEAGAERFDLAIFFCCFVLLVNLLLLNMLIGVQCQVVSAVAEAEREESDANHIKQVVEELWQTAVANDHDGDGEIDKHEFLDILHDPEACRILDSLGVDVLMLYDMTQQIFDELLVERGADVGLGFNDFLKAIFRFRGSRPATVKDLVQTRCILTKALGGKGDVQFMTEVGSLEESLST